MSEGATIRTPAQRPGWSLRTILRRLPIMFFVLLFTKIMKRLQDYKCLTVKKQRKIFLPTLSGLLPKSSPKVNDRMPGTISIRYSNAMTKLSRFLSFSNNFKRVTKQLLAVTEKLRVADEKTHVHLQSIKLTKFCVMWFSVSYIDMFNNILDYFAPSASIAELMYCDEDSCSL